MTQTSAHADTALHGVFEHVRTFTTEYDPADNDEEDTMFVYSDEDPEETTWNIDRNFAEICRILQRFGEICRNWENCRKSQKFAELCRNCQKLTEIYRKMQENQKNNKNIQKSRKQTQNPSVKFP